MYQYCQALTAPGEGASSVAADNHAAWRLLPIGGSGGTAREPVARACTHVYMCQPGHDAPCQ